MERWLSPLHLGPYGQPNMCSWPIICGPYNIKSEIKQRSQRVWDPGVPSGNSESKGWLASRLLAQIEGLRTPSNASPKENDVTCRHVFA